LLYLSLSCNMVIDTIDISQDVTNWLHTNFSLVVNNYIPIFGGEIGVNVIYKCHIFENITIVDPYGIFCCCHSWY
jgi:hypothetical protein